MRTALYALYALAFAFLVLAFASPHSAHAQGRADYYTDHRLNVPPGHYPPPGECKLWYPNRPPGQQPPPTDCEALIGRVPSGAVVLYHGGVYDPGYRYDDVGAVPAIIRRVLGIEVYDDRYDDRRDRGRDRDDDWERDDDQYDDRRDDGWERDDRGGFGQELGIPPGHYPPPGECRIWYPNRPPGQQPPPVPCGDLYGGRFDGAVVLYENDAWDPRRDYDWDAVPEVIRRLFR